MKFVPVNGKALFQRDGIGGERMTQGGIIVPEVALEKPVTGTILAISGPEQEVRETREDRTVVTFHVPPVKVGDRVLIGKYSGITAEIEGKTVEIINLTDILGVI
jgi:chaperonin GroES